MSLLINGINYITAAEIIKNLGVTRQTFWRWRNSNRIPAGYRFRDGRILFTIDEVEEIKQYANRIEFLDQTTKRRQLKLFNDI